MGADDDETQVVEVSESVSSSGEVNSKAELYILPGDAFRDAPLLEWIMAKADPKETTFDDFNDLLISRFNEKVATGGLKYLAAYEARTTGMASYKVSTEVDWAIEDDGEVTEKNLLML